jgi:hypothetical protein
MECADEQICRARHDTINARLAAMDDALRLRTHNLEKRLEVLNELRAEVVRDRDVYLKKEIYDIKTLGYDSWCSTINTRLTVIETRTVVWTTALGIFFIVVELAFHFWKLN